MAEDDILKYLSRQPQKAPKSAPPRMRVARRAPRAEAAPQETYRDFSATHLFCPRCKQAMPVREKIMLFLPDGDLYDYACTTCGTSVGTRKAGQ